MIKSPYATRFTLYGERNMANRKPFRNKMERRAAKSVAIRNPSGHYTSNAPRRYHNEPAFNPSRTMLRHYDRFVADCTN